MTVRDDHMIQQHQFHAEGPDDSNTARVVRELVHVNWESWRELTRVGGEVHWNRLARYVQFVGRMRMHHALELQALCRKGTEQLHLWPGESHPTEVIDPSHRASMSPPSSRDHGGIAPVRHDGIGVAVRNLWRQVRDDGGVLQGMRRDENYVKAKYEAALSQMKECPERRSIFRQYQDLDLALRQLHVVQSLWHSFSQSE
ncbi:MAG: hypothetical protein KatS3mg111_0422 [Pirellulaceae bacterium]|nr:MAG: hypothetical protein KatS3mg111_0422 [Pirellulaceae bacterium]